MRRRQKAVVMECWQWDEKTTTSQRNPWESVPKWVEELIPHWGKMWLIVPMKNAAGSGMKLYDGDWLVKGPNEVVFVVTKAVFDLLFYAYIKA